MQPSLLLQAAVMPSAESTRWPGDVKARPAVMTTSKATEVQSFDKGGLLSRPRGSAVTIAGAARGGEAERVKHAMAGRGENKTRRDDDERDN